MTSFGITSFKNKDHCACARVHTAVQSPARLLICKAPHWKDRVFSARIDSHEGSIVDRGGGIPAAAVASAQQRWGVYSSGPHGGPPGAREGATWCTELLHHTGEEEVGTNVIVKEKQSRCYKVVSVVSSSYRYILVLQVHPGCTCTCVSIPSLVCTFTHMYMQDTIPGGVCWSCEACQWCSGGRPLFTPLWPCQCLPAGQPLLQWMDDTAWQCVQRQRTGWVQPSNTASHFLCAVVYVLP